MNEVYVSGRIVKLQRRPVPPDVDRFYFQMQTTQRDPTGRIIVDTFVVMTWNKTAQWAANNLHTGDEVLVKGALTNLRSDNVHTTVISALRIIITQRGKQSVPVQE